MASNTIVSRTLSLSGRSGVMQPTNLENLGPGHAGRANFWVPAVAGMAAIPSPLALITLPVFGSAAALGWIIAGAGGNSYADAKGLADALVYETLSKDV